MSAHLWGEALFGLIAIAIVGVIWRMIAEALANPPELIPHPNDPPDRPVFEWVMIAALIVVALLGALFAL